MRARTWPAIGRAWLASAGTLLALLATLANADVLIPRLTSRVTDLTNTLAPNQRAELESKLAAFEQGKGSQIAVLIVPTTEPEEIEQFSIRVAEAWKVGRKGTDDGVLLIVSKNDRELRIEVGYGLEGAIPDAIANRVVEDVIIPFFKRGDYYGGIDAGVDQLMRLVDGEPLPAPKSRDRSWNGFGNILPMLFIFIFVVGGILRAALGRFGGASAVSVIVGIAAWAMAGLGIALLFAFIAFLISLFTGGSGRRGWGGGGFGGRGGGFGGGGGGWSGGGGGFGGGGASGRW